MDDREKWEDEARRQAAYRPPLRQQLAFILNSIAWMAFVMVVVVLSVVLVLTVPESTAWLKAFEYTTMVFEHVVEPIETAAPARRRGRVGKGREVCCERVTRTKHLSQ